MPILSHLPGDAPTIVLYSGDEDNADVAWNDEEFDAENDATALELGVDGELGNPTDHPQSGARFLEELPKAQN